MPPLIPCSFLCRDLSRNLPAACLLLVLGIDRYAVFSTEDLALSAGAVAAADRGNGCGGIHVGGSSSSLNTNANIATAAVNADKKLNVAAAAAAFAERTTTLSPNTFKRIANFTPAKLPQYSSGATLIQLIQFQKYSPTNWDITPPAKEALLKALNSTYYVDDRSEFRWELNLKFTRPGPAQAAVMQWDAERSLTQEDGHALAEALMVNRTSGAKVAKLPINAMVRPLLYLGTSGEPQWACDDGFAGTATAVLSVDSFGGGGDSAQRSSYWELGTPQMGVRNNSVDPFCVLGSDLGHDPIDCAQLAGALTPPKAWNGGLCMVVVSPGYPDALGGFLNLAGYGVVALYIVILGTIGTTVRTALLGQVSAV